MRSGVVVVVAATRCSSGLVVVVLVVEAFARRKGWPISWQQFEHRAFPMANGSSTSPCHHHS